MNNIRSVVLTLLALAITCGAIWFTAINLAEAYGSGPPYYGRTTNMDKWKSPILFLALVDVVALVVSGALLYLARRHASRQPSGSIRAPGTTRGRNSIPTIPLVKGTTTETVPRNHLMGHPPAAAKHIAGSPN